MLIVSSCKALCNAMCLNCVIQINLLCLVIPVKWGVTGTWHKIEKYPLPYHQTTEWLLSSGCKTPQFILLTLLLSNGLIFCFSFTCFTRLGNPQKTDSLLWSAVHVCLDPYSGHIMKVTTRQHCMVFAVERYNTGSNGGDLWYLTLKHTQRL